MEDLIVSAKEHKLLKKFQKQLEECFRVEIRMPKTSSLESDVVFVSISGEKQGIDSVKKFLSDKMNLPPKHTEYKENVLLITLSDSEEEAPSIKDDSICIIESSSYSKNSAEVENTKTVHDPLDDSVCIIENSVNPKARVMNVYECERKRKKKKKNSEKNKKLRTKTVSPSSDAEVSGSCKVTSTTDDVVRKEINTLDDSICVLDEGVASIKDPDVLIPLHKQNNSHEEIINNQHLYSQQVATNNHVIMEPLPVLRCLRPVVIDGSNVAIEHGRAVPCFSTKGIKLAVEYFLNRGHTQVTAFVPRFRRNGNPYRNFPTKDPEILDDLAAKQLVVFTPSRRVNGQLIASYDDRFIVELAATNGGVIVSNDNYRDLIDESESFKEAIQKRLLMFCFVGDVFMVPEDPLGRNGPKLKDYLSFPPESKKS